MKLAILFPELYYEYKYLDSIDEVVKNLKDQDRLAVVTVDILSYFTDIKLEGYEYKSYFKQLVVCKNKISRITKKTEGAKGFSLRLQCLFIKQR